MTALTHSLRSFAYGLTLPLRAMSLIASSPVLLFWSFLPMALTLALDVLLISQLRAWAQGAIDSLLRSHGYAPEGWLAIAISMAFWPLLILLAIAAFAFLSGIVAAPLNDFLAEQAEPRATPPLPPAPPAGVARRLRLLAIDLSKACLSAAIAVFAILLSWIPGLNLLAVPLLWLNLSFQLLSYPQTRRSEGVLDGARFIGRHPWACLGFGACVSVFFAIPLVSSFFLPLAVVSGTLLYARAQAGARAELPPLR